VKYQLATKVVLEPQTCLKARIAISLLQRMSFMYLQICNLILIVNELTFQEKNYELDRFSIFNYYLHSKTQHTTAKILRAKKHMAWA